MNGGVESWIKKFSPRNEIRKEKERRESMRMRCLENQPDLSIKSMVERLRSLESGIIQPRDNSEASKNCYIYTKDLEILLDTLRDMECNIVNPDTLIPNSIREILNIIKMLQAKINSYISGNNVQLIIESDTLSLKPVALKGACHWGIRGMATHEILDRSAILRRFISRVRLIISSHNDIITRYFGEESRFNELILFACLEKNWNNNNDLTAVTPELKTTTDKILEEKLTNPETGEKQLTLPKTPTKELYLALLIDQGNTDDYINFLFSLTQEDTSDNDVSYFLTKMFHYSCYYMPHQQGLKLFVNFITKILIQAAPEDIVERNIKHWLRSDYLIRGLYDRKSCQFIDCMMTFLNYLRKNDLTIDSFEQLNLDWGIYCYNRYPLDVLQDLLKNEVCDRLVLYISARDDWNSALSRNGPQEINIIRNAFTGISKPSQIVPIEVGSEEELVNGITKVFQRLVSESVNMREMLQIVQMVTVSCHGNPDNLDLLGKPRHDVHVLDSSSVLYYLKFLRIGRIPLLMLTCQDQTHQSQGIIVRRLDNSGTQYNLPTGLYGGLKGLLLEDREGQLIVAEITYNQ
jgi:hypothetical protein